MSEEVRKLKRTFDRDDFIKYVEDHLKGRYEFRNVNNIHDECNFIAGVMTATTFLMCKDPNEQISDIIPPKWIFGPMFRGTSILEEE
jgi:hypothetical protein